MIEQDQTLERAISHLKDLIKENPDWSFRFCVGRISKMHDLDIGLIMSEFAKRKRKNKSKQKKEKSKRGKDDYPADTPWWVKY